VAQPSSPARFLVVSVDPAAGGVEALEARDLPGARALRGEQVLPGIDFLYTDDAGAEIWTSAASVPLSGDRGEIVGGAVYHIPMLVPRTGLEPVRGCPQRFLRPQRLPFRHPGAPPL
jgi:hypothetical protein